VKEREDVMNVDLKHVDVREKKNMNVKRREEEVKNGINFLAYARKL
jgi:hypothetical protein